MAIDNRARILSSDSHESKNSVKNPDRRKQSVTCLGEKLPSTAFTLIELLVIIATIGLLRACCYPLYRKPRNRRESIACLINVEQIGLASNICSDDRDGHVPTFGTWLYRRSGGLTTGTLYPYLNSKSVYISPTDKIELASKRSPKATSRAAAPSRGRSRHARDYSYGIIVTYAITPKYRLLKLTQKPCFTWKVI